MRLMKAVYRFVDKHLGVFYVVNLGMITALLTMSFEPEIMLIFIISYLLTGNHWRKSRDVHLENGNLKLKKPYHNRSLNPIKRVDDIISNNKNGKIVISLIESSKFKINGVIKTPESLGFVDKRTKEPNTKYRHLKSFCEGDGIIDFNLQHHDYFKTPVKNKVAKQMERFRDALAEALDVEIEKGRDYSFYKGVFVWKTITFRDDFTPLDVKFSRDEAVEYVRSKQQLQSLEEIKKQGGFSNPEIEDEENQDYTYDKPNII